MNPRINQLVKSLLQKDSLDQCTLPELVQFAERHPYFGAAQLLLTKKMQTANPEKYDEQLQKTFLFFHNPLWVEHLLNDTGNASITKAKNETGASVNIPAESVTIADNTVQPPPEVSPISNPKPEAAVTQSQKAELLQQASIASPLKPAEADTSLIFEPYHTVDYFASQGIKFREEEKPKDKFGQQLKSFTEWLKTMKRLPVTEIAATNEPATEKKVEEMAEKSLQEREILTEAMAQVWEKQGNSDKAIEIYSKLSLLEPSKSAYFAAKIEVLKK